MDYWIVPANKKYYDYESAFNELKEIDWKTNNYKFKIGDIVYLYATKPEMKIKIAAIVTKINISADQVIDDSKFWVGENIYTNATYTRLKFVENINSDLYTLKNLNNQYEISGNIQNPRKIYSENLINDLNTKIKKVSITNALYTEGKKIISLNNRYERNKYAREKCIEIHGVNCKICDFNFEEKYGEHAKGFIHVHHIKKISDISHEYIVDPESDLIPLCPNCHSVVHMNKFQEMSIDEIKRLIKN